MWQRIRYWLVWMVATVVLVGCAGGAQQPAAPAQTEKEAAQPAAEQASGAITPELIEAAKKEGTVVLYTGAHTRSQFTGLIERFEKTYGIKVEGTRKPTGDIMAMVAAEQEAGNVRADVIGVADLASLAVLRSKGLLAKFQPANAGDIYEVLQIPEGDAVPFTMLLLGIAYNTKEVTGDKVPKSWQQLADTDWGGRVAHGNPATSGTAAGFVQTVVSLVGWDFYKKLGANGILLQDSSTAVAQMVVTGEALIALPGVESRVAPLNRKGEPIAMSYPEEGVPMNAYYLAVSAQAPHPNAARLLVAFHLAEETQRYLVEELSSRSVLTTIGPPAGMPGLDEVKVRQPDFAWLKENKQQMLDQFNSYLKR